MTPHELIKKYGLGRDIAAHLDMSYNTYKKRMSSEKYRDIPHLALERAVREVVSRDIDSLGRQLNANYNNETSS